MPTTDENYYADAELHQQIAEELQASDTGGKPGNWTKTKAKLADKEYEQQGGEFKDDKDENGNEDEKDKSDTNEGEQDEDTEMKDRSEDEEAEKEDVDKPDSDTTTCEKRKRPAKDQAQSKKQKANSGAAKDKSESISNGTHGSKHDKPDAPAPQGSNERLPKKGQSISWKAMPGWVHGKVLEIVTDEKDMEGQHIKASKDDPRIAIEADSGKFCVHKPDNCYFEDE